MCIVHREQREKEIITEMKLKERGVIIEELANSNKIIWSTLEIRAFGFLTRPPSTRRRWFRLFLRDWFSELRLYEIFAKKIKET